MTSLILKIYEFFCHHRRVCFLSLIGTIIALVSLVLHIKYKEDISDFLPLDGKEVSALKAYQNFSGASKVFAIFQYHGEGETIEPIIEAIDDFVYLLQETDTTQCVADLMWQVDMSQFDDVAGELYQNIAYYLTDADYARIDSLLSLPEYAKQQLQNDKQLLLFPSGGMLTSNIGRDPLNLFSPILGRLQQSDTQINYESYDGYIFSPDMQRAIVMMSSPFGTTESERNGELLSMLDNIKCSIRESHEMVEIQYLGAPIIAVGNANQIKQDSILSVAIAMILILALLLYVFRNLRSLLLISFSIAWGWLFALGFLSIIHDNISIIVVGISSIIIGIAVNYPLHVIAHMGHTGDKRSAIREIISPLVIGNITTVGAFLTLVPLRSIALRDLGIFAALLLVGTILFVLLFLPHLIKARKEEQTILIGYLSDIRLENHRWFMPILALLTIVFAYFGWNTQFDSNMAHINYMTDEERENMAYLNSLIVSDDASTQLFVLSEADNENTALMQCETSQSFLDSLVTMGMITRNATCTNFLVSQSEQQKRIERWNAFVATHKDAIDETLRQYGSAEGFNANSFVEFSQIMRPINETKSLESLQAAASQMFAGYVYNDSLQGCSYVLNCLTVPQEHMAAVKALLTERDLYVFDLNMMNSSIANSLSDNFNYIGWACGFIVFFFLWASMGSIELAIISFIPMAISWLWILGIMALLGVQFNIVNIILATFIFGQGDDYTIFMTEGASFEYAYRRKILSSYKSSIIVSALIMFIGIGTLIVARHPALHSLAEVTIIGMFTVVLMAYTIPPYLFRWMVMSNRIYRQRPIRLMRWLVSLLASIVFFIQLLSVYVWGFIVVDLFKNQTLFRKYVHSLFLFDLTHIPKVSFNRTNFTANMLNVPSVIICNHQSMLDSAIFMALSHKCILVSNQKVSANPIISKVYKWMGFISLTNDGIENQLPLLRKVVDEGYSIVIFPEGERNADSSILRFHKGAFYMADLLKLDILPIVLHGANHVLPRNSFSLYEGEITIKALPRISQQELSTYETLIKKTKHIHQLYLSAFDQLVKEKETIAYFTPFIIDRYRYKGADVVQTVKRNLKKASVTADITPTDGDIYVEDNGYGEYAFALALTHRHNRVFAIMADEDRATLLKHSAADMTNNLEIIHHVTNEINIHRL